MDTFEWDRSKEDLLTEMRIALSDVFDETDYTIVRNPTQGEKMNNIYRKGRNKRSAFVVPLQSRMSFTFAFNTEYLPAIKMSGAKLGELKEIKQDRCPNWRQYTNLSYRDMDPYDLPEEFSHLQAQDMSKLGFMQDLIRGIRKIADAGEQKSVKKETVVVNNANTNTSPLLKRAFMFLEDGDWQSADEYCEKVLDLDPENAQAYLGKLMAQLCVKQVSMLKDYKSPFDYNNNYRKAYRFADDKLKSELEGYIKFINDRNENARLQEIYSDAIHKMNYAETENVFLEAAEMFESIEKFKDSKELAKQCREKGEEAYRNAQYDKAVSLFENPNNEADCEAAKSIFEKLGDYKDSKSYLDKYDEKVEEVRKDAVYYKAMETKNQVILDMDKKIENLEKVIQLFESVSECKDAEKQAELCRKEIEEIKAKQKALEQEKAAEEAKKKRIKKILSISIPSVIAVVVAFVILLNAVIIPNNKYNQALEYINNEDYLHANLILRSLGDYKDSNQLINEHKIDFQNYISAGDLYTVGLKSDGTVVATGYNYYGQCNVSDWSDIVAVSAGKNHTVGLKSNGTVVATGGNYLGKCDVSGWSDIVAVSAGDYHTVGLKSDGTVVATGYNLDSRCYVSGWSDIVAVSAGGGHTVGLKSDGTVVTTGKNEDGQCDVSDWSDIVAVSAGNWHTVGLKSDGTVVSTGKNDYDQRDVSYWKDIVAVSVGSGYTVGLKSDGTVVTTGENDDGQRDVSDWSDIVAVSAGNWHTVGLKSDGTVVTIGENDYGQCDVSEWKLW